MLRKLICLIPLLLGTGVVKSQDIKKTEWGLHLNFSRSTIEIESFPEPNYAAFELKTGGRFGKRLTNIISIKTGLSLGVKFKRESYFTNGPNGSHTEQEFVLPSLDEASSNRNHFYAEIPLLTIISIPKSPFSLVGGLCTRLWFPHNADVDDFTNMKELGYVFGANVSISRKISAELSFYHGLTDFYHRSVSTGGPFNDLRVTNRYVQLGLAYQLN